MAGVLKIMSQPNASVGIMPGDIESQKVLKFA